MNPVFAQNAVHLNSWLRFSLLQTITDKWWTEAEFQHRQQNDYSQKITDVFDKNLLSSFPYWVHYQHKENLSYSFSPFACYWHSTKIENDTDKEKQHLKEIRFSIAADMKYAVIKKLWLTKGTWVEYRNFQNSKADFIRIRNRPGLRYLITDKWNLAFYDELFLNLKGAAPKHFFDHNRLAFLINYKPINQLRIETGYMYITRLVGSKEELLHEQNFLLQLYYTLSHKQHKKHPNLQDHS